jgi:hypothetical protein
LWDFLENKGRCQYTQTHTITTSKCDHIEDLGFYLNYNRKSLLDLPLGSKSYTEIHIFVYPQIYALKFTWRSPFLVPQVHSYQNAFEAKNQYV